ncbi:MAG: helix-hairpin-helix domain-containing protein [Lachnospiraceae bacterium]|nr:helix-hairpin-helix domain-containing protein [Lachnospiraceae bacterium]
MKKTIRKTMAQAAMVLLYVMAAVLFTGGCGSGMYEKVAYRAVPMEAAGREEAEKAETASGQEETGGSGTSGVLPEDGAQTSDEGVSRTEGNAEEQPIRGNVQDIKTIVVYICGAVKYPGVYTFPEGGRVCEAVAAAGGFAEDAEAVSLNLAAFLTDGEQITVLTKEEAASLPLKGADTCAGPGAAYGSGNENGGGAKETPVNLNTADVPQLMSLNGIGEAKAAAIIEYRETNGSFSSAEEIMKVSGIGEGLYAKIKDHITVGSG